MRYLLLVGLFCLAAASSAKAPDCASWPVNMAQVKLKNAGLMNISDIDASKTRTTRLASEHIGNDLYRQVYAITFHTRTGKSIKVITRSDASSQECSMSGVDVYVVSREMPAASQ